MDGFEGLQKGKIVWIPCIAKDGMFPNERYFRVDIPQGVTSTVSGFIPSEDVRETKEAGYEVRAIVAGRIDDKVSLVFRGDLLSTSNPVAVPGTWLTSSATLHK